MSGPLDPELERVRLWSRLAIAQRRVRKQRLARERVTDIRPRIALRAVERELRAHIARHPQAD